ncbi:HAD superfamily phosphatase, subfamily IIIa [Candidatus Phytoplasma luffae]|uniref:HAD superfamily phosphatase, subfamily IIIa n=1 Tax=Loofah witches'-broom phytoplasma TaxID=35773 RepID=A0A975ILT5_LOWBP|nr:HAD-IA family hydrolase [Candidatus Phytoplasma luffae]QTX02663.1 HAD superfamily phosphatase, subfamily IIIa [Candidatus Phytoplasma luffae]
MKSKYKLLPSFYYNSVFSIPYDEFKKKNIKALFFDLDNTLLNSEEKQLNDKTKHFLKKLSSDFEIVIISNASLKKIKKNIFFEQLKYIYLNLFQKKPSAWGLKKALKLLNINSDEAIMIGDQLRTDIASANKSDIISVLVKPLNRQNESFITKLFRYFTENKFINKIKKIDHKEYNSKFKNFL